MSTEKQTGAPNQLGARVELVKQIMSLLRDLAIFLLGALLLFFPAKLNKILADAGFVEGSIAGFKWQNSLNASNESLKAADDAIARLRSQNETLIKALSDMTAMSGSAKTEVARLQADNQQVSAAAQQVQATVSNTIKNNEPLIEHATVSNNRRTYPDKAFCYQEDRLQDGPDRFSVHCHETKEKCDTARGPSTTRKQTQCEFTDLTQAQWNPGRGWMGSWFQFSPEPFGPPFPQLK
jgi:hypothetical protein